MSARNMHLVWLKLRLACNDVAVEKLFGGVSTTTVDVSMASRVKRTHTEDTDSGSRVMSLVPRRSSGQDI